MVKIEFHMDAVRWPHPWQPLRNESAALAFGRSINRDVCQTVVEEVRRELPIGHPLYGADLVAIAYDANTHKEFLLATDLESAPFVIVHLTWQEEKEAPYPNSYAFPSLDAFVSHEEVVRRPRWRFWQKADRGPSRLV